MNSKAAGALALALSCCGCVMAKYPSMPIQGPAATLVFSKGHHSSLGISGMQTYTISENHQCTDKKVAATLLWTTPHSQPAQIAAGHRVVVLGQTVYNYSAGLYQVVQRGCEGSASFVTEAGHAYDVVQVAPFSGTCHFEVTDQASHEAPASLKQSNDATCGAYFQLQD